MAHPYGLGLRQMVIDVANSVGDDDQQQQQSQQPQQLLHQLQKQSHLQINCSQFSQPVDFRMKRHPELQPCVPSDRDRTLAGSKAPINGGGGSSNLTTKANSQYKPVNKSKLATATLNSTNEDNLSSTKPKKCVSMTRLDQLAQPKNRNFKRNPIQTTSTVPSSSLSSSNTTSTTTSSLTSNKNYNQNQPQQQQQSRNLTQKRQSTESTKEKTSKQNSKNIKIPNSPTKSKPASQQSQEKQDQLPEKKQKRVTIRKVSQQKDKTPTSLALQQQQQQSQQSTPDKHVITIVSNETPTTTPIGDKIVNQTFDTGRKSFQNLGYNVQGSLWDELNGCDSFVSQPSTEAVSSKKLNESSIADQLSEMSMNDRHYQSANSELVQESETSTNGINFPKNLGSLCNDLEADLIAEGMVKPGSTKATTLPANEQDLTDNNKENGERRLKADEELKEVARREEEERQNRQLLVESILSKINHSS